MEDKVRVIEGEVYRDERGVITSLNDFHLEVPTGFISYIIRIRRWCADGMGTVGNGSGFTA